MTDDTAMTADTEEWHTWARPDSLDRLFQKLMLAEPPDVVGLIDWDTLLERCGA